MGTAWALGKAARNDHELVEGPSSSPSAVLRSDFGSNTFFTRLVVHHVDLETTKALVLQNLTDPYSTGSISGLCGPR